MVSGRRVAVGAVLLVCCAQYFVAEQIAASAWHDPPYSWTQDYISELGTLACTAGVCSPLHVVVPVSLALEAVLVVSAAVLLLPVLETRTARVAVPAVTAVHAVGNLVVASLPWQPQAGANTYHYFGAALATTGGVALVAVVGVDAMTTRGRRSYGALSLGCALASLSGLLVLRWNTMYDVGLPDGLLERLAVDPVVVWLVGTGVVVLACTIRGRVARWPRAKRPPLHKS